MSITKHERHTSTEGDAVASHALDHHHPQRHDGAIELARRANLRPGARILEIARGQGSSWRDVADVRSCHVVRLDLRGDALDLPFEAQSFEAVWTEHIQADVIDKYRFYDEISRVLVPGGTLLFHDAFRGTGDAAHHAIARAEGESPHRLWEPSIIRIMLHAFGLDVVEWEDTTRASLRRARRLVSRMESAEGTPGVLPPEALAEKSLDSMVRNLEERRVVTCLAVLQKRRERSAKDSH